MKKIIIAAAIPAFALAASAFTFAPSAFAPSAFASSACHSSSGLPDGHCTPGATWSRVTQGNIHSTICKSGWDRDRPPLGEFHRGAQALSAPLYGDYAGSKLSSYEEDHLIPLELGGSPTSPLNLWPEAHPTSYTKDGVEDTLNHAVCSGRVKLAPAQRDIGHNWKTAEHVLGLK